MSTAINQNGSQQDNLILSAAAEHAHGADRPCRCAQGRAVFEESFPDLSMRYPQGRRLMRKPLGCWGGVVSRLLLADCQVQSELRVVPLCLVEVLVVLRW